MIRPLTFVATMSLAALLVALMPGAAHPATAIERSAESDALAAKILDDSRSAEERQKMVEESSSGRPEDAARLILSMSNGLPGMPDLKEEYRRIPWIWRIAIAAGKRNQPEELAHILEVSLPQKGEKLRDWQAVVIGGGIINGISLVGGWPSERIGSIVADSPSLRERWEQVQEQAVKMTDDENVFKGTRYDAIRILGVGSWDRRGAQIFRYLLRGVDDELQMGAISALNDIRSPGVGQALLSGISFYSAKNREMAFDALIREDSRILELLFTVEEGRLTADQVGESRIARLKKVANPDLRAKVEKQFGDS